MKLSLSTSIQSLARVLLVATLLVVPVQSFWLRILEQAGVADKLFFVASYWYEFGLFSLFALTLIGAIWLRFKLTTLDILSVCLCGLAGLSFVWADHTLGDHIIGLRYSMLPLYCYWLARLAQVSPSSLNRPLTVVFWAVIGVALFQLILWLAFPSSSLVALLAMPPLHRVSTLFQVYGSLPGPNQFGSYMVLALIIAWLGQFRWPVFLALLSLLFIALSFSRGALLALGVAFVVYLVAERSKQAWRLAGVAFGLVAIIFFGFAFAYQGKLHDLITHGASQREHIMALQVGIDKFLTDGTLANQLVGYGAGMAGPATFARGVGFIPESWYVQILYEYGVVGLLLFAAFFWLTIRKAASARSTVIGIALLAMLANNLFLHVFSDNPAATSLLFILIGSLETNPLITSKDKR